MRLLHTGKHAEHPGDLVWKWKEHTAPARTLFYQLDTVLGSNDPAAANNLLTIPGYTNPVTMLRNLCTHFLEAGDALAEHLEEWEAEEKEKKAKGGKP